MNAGNEAPPQGLQIISPVFREGATIPEQYTCRGQNVNPPLNFFNVPPETQSLALIMHDPDAVSGDFTHWLLWDIPANTETIAANSVPVGAVQGLNGSDQSGYTGPCPPPGTGTHHYVFELYALSSSLGLAQGDNRHQLEGAMKGHVLDSATLTGLLSADAAQGLDTKVLPAI